MPRSAPAATAAAAARSRALVDDLLGVAAPAVDPLLVALTLKNQLAHVNPESVAAHRWYAASLKQRRGLKTYFNNNFDALMASSKTRATQRGMSSAPIVHETSIRNGSGKEQPFLFIVKALQYDKQYLGPETPNSWHALVPESLAREKSASDLVEKGLTPHFCLVYKTVVHRPYGGVVAFTRYTEFGGEKTVAQCLQDATYRTSLAFELHAKIQIATAFAVALAHTRTPFYQGDLHTNNVMVQPLAAGTEGVAIGNPFCPTYKSRFLFRIIDFVAHRSAVDYGVFNVTLPQPYPLVFGMLFAKRRFALADVLAFYIDFDRACGTHESMFTRLAFTYVYENMESKQEDVAEGLARMLLTFYDDPPGDETLYGAQRRRRRRGGGSSRHRKASTRRRGASSRKGSTRRRRVSSSRQR